jgi:hypothetical protein
MNPRFEFDKQKTVSGDIYIYIILILYLTLLTLYSNASMV